MTNTNPATGIRYGVIAGNSLDATVFDDLFYSGTNISEQEALDSLREEISIEAAERGFDDEDDRDNWFEGEYEVRSSYLEIEEPTIEGEKDGVKYRISWLGGAPLLWVLEGPVGECYRLCSLCVPNAGDLDSGFKAGQFLHNRPPQTFYECYVVPCDWLRSKGNA